MPYSRLTLAEERKGPADLWFTLLKYVGLLLPYVIAELLAYAPAASYLTAWFGSLGILYVSITGKIKSLPTDRPLQHQILRPIVFTQAIFVSYMALSSIFYFMDQQGYFYLQYDPSLAASTHEIASLAEAQRMYVLGHAALVMGMLFVMDYRSSGRWELNTNMPLPQLTLFLAGGALCGGYIFGLIPGLSRVASRLGTLSLVASVLSLVLSAREMRFGFIFLNLLIYGLNLLQALLSGWKEQILVVVLLLGLFAYPYYKRTVTAAAPVVIFAFLAFVPTYNSTLRALAWKGDLQTSRAAAIAYNNVQSIDIERAKNNTWNFLTKRASLVSNFKMYLRQTPEKYGFYGLEFVERGIKSIVPRVVWPGKPNLERLAMQRVYDYGVASPRSPISAKPHFVTDSYLSGGIPGAYFFCLIYGILASLASRLAERWFGGYLIGTALIYTSFFQIMWKGSAFELFFPTVFWSFILMYTFFIIGKYTGIISKY